MEKSVSPISIITPSYNQASYLEETILSVLAQADVWVDLLVIDGGSTDGSVDIIRRYADRLAYWISETDAGQTSAINKGFRRARGDVWAWLNSDDTYRPGACASAAAYLRVHHEIDVVYGDINFIDAAGQVLGTMGAWDFDPQLQICATNLIPQPATFFRRSAFERVGGLDETLHYALDYDLWVRMWLAGARFAHVREVWATYRLHPASKTEAQAERFAQEVARVVERAFATGHLPAAWRSIADSNLEQLRAETQWRLGHPREARRHFWRAVQRHPWRLKSLALLACAVDMRLGHWMRRARWRLAGRTDEPSYFNVRG